MVAKALFEEIVDATPRKKRLISQWTNLPFLSSTKGRPPALTDNAKDKLNNFLYRNDVSFTLPGRNNQVYIGKSEDGEKEFRTKKYLLWTFNELLSILKKEKDTDLSSLKFSTVYRYVKANKEFVMQCKIPQVACLCPTCENYVLCAEGINKTVEEEEKLPSTCHDLMDKIACQDITEDCCKRKCDKCPAIDLEFLCDYDSFSFYKWGKGEKYQEKVLCEMKGSEMMESLKSDMPQLLEHFFRKRTQSRKYKECIEDLRANEIAIHVDYSENYKNKQQGEIKAAFYGQGLFTLYTVCVYANEGGVVKCDNYALVTQENDHDSDVSFGLNKFIIQHLEKRYNFNSIKFWSDGCASQFRSQFAFYLLTKFDSRYDIQWHFFETNHGKGCVDGIGGTVKDAVYRHVLSKQVVIASPQIFAEYANKICQGISVLFVEDLDLSYHDECRANAQYVKGTLQVHFIQRTIRGGKCVLNFFETSESIVPLNSKECKLNREVCQTGDYMIVQYEGSHFPGIVEGRNQARVIVKCMQKSNAPGSTWHWPAKVDIHDYPMQDILECIEMPKVLAGGARMLNFYVPEVVNEWGEV